MAKYELIHFEIKDVEIQVKRYYERRKNVRISVGKDSVILRIPSFMNSDQRHKYHIWAKEWIEKQMSQSNGAINHLFPVRYDNNSIVKCMGENFELKIISGDRLTSNAKLTGNKIKLKLDQSLLEKEKSDSIRRLLSRVLGKKYKDEVEHRLRLINKHYFQHKVNSVRLKYNRTNWGSCSCSGNINLSTRLLMAPEWVRDYVIVHELAHINEMNHSSKYWSIVEKVYPEYKKAEKWLKVNGAKCDFIPVDSNKKRKPDSN